MTVSPLKFTFPAGVYSAMERVTVRNGSTTTPITVTARPMDVEPAKGCGVVPAPRSQMDIRMAGGPLRPGEARTAVVHFHVPAGVGVDAAAVFIATPAGPQPAGGGGRAADGIGVQFITTRPGTAAPVCHHQVAASHGTPGAGGPLFVVGMIAAVLAAVACLTVMRLRRHRRT